MIAYHQLYDAWAARDKPSANTLRMTRTALRKVATALGAADWREVRVLPRAQALVLLDGVTEREELAAQSRSNYRHYVRKLYDFAVRERIESGVDGDGTLWPQVPESVVERRAQLAYQRFVRWAIGRGLWRSALKSSDLLAWALSAKASGDKHWRQEYARLQHVWVALVSAAKLSAIDFPDLPDKRNARYGLDLCDWPPRLRDAWDCMCRDAMAPLRDGGMRPWRDVTREGYQRKLGLFLGWITRERAEVRIADETWATLLSPARCQAFINWLVARSSNEYINPGHTAFLRTVRGLHRFLLGSPQDVIDGLNELCCRCEVEERDKAARMVPYPALHEGMQRLLQHVTQASSRRHGVGCVDRRLAELHVDALLLGLLATRALRSRNIRELRIGQNLRRNGDGYELVFLPREMKGHRKYETSWPRDLVPVLDSYLRSGYRVLAKRSPAEGDVLLLTRNGTPFTMGSLHARVRAITQKWVGKPLHPHICRHIVATHGAQVLKMTPPELAAMLGHRSVMTVMRYYEVTDPRRAAARLDELRRNGASGNGVAGTDQRAAPT